MTVPAAASTARRNSGAVLANRIVLALTRHWLLAFNLFFGLYVGAPWLAPVFMEAGNAGAGKAIYLVYSTQCHQLPERSFFLFGPRLMYSLGEVQAAWQNTNDPLVLRQFVGDPAIGWKVAWSDRMVSLYTSVFAGGLIFALFRKRARPLPIWAFALLVLPMAVDGTTHLVSDFAGIGQGFRDSNAWLAWLTQGALPATFYAGDALGSFNSWMRLITGVLFGLGVAGLALPYMEEFAGEAAAEIEAKFARAGIPL